jgi:hypothetical protein
VFVINEGAPFAADQLPTASAVGTTPADSVDALTGAVRVNSVDELTAALQRLFSK